MSEDDSALLALDAGDNVASVYNDDSEDNNVNGTGELVIDTTELSTDGEGFNVGATVQIGRIEDGSGNPADSVDPTSIGDNVVTDTDSDAAFKLTNNFETVPGGTSDDQVRVTIDTDKISAAGEEGDGTLDASLYFIGTQYDGESATETQVIERSDGTHQSTHYTMSHEDEIYFALYIDTDEATNPDDFTGNVTISAEPEPES
ncbi:hypothetical protein [Halorubrum sp. CGM4_25_10-8A]|uniref:hypothetical protein n=1 Tax=Halorubrum sp. CGM4_25_10-8A TaxID=2518116 RepID=UPI0010F4D7D5|nr:hypothetical protein [Halorubrum sp. CGM4_25_10-8A]